MSPAAKRVALQAVDLLFGTVIAISGLVQALGNEGGGLETSTQALGLMAPGVAIMLRRRTPLGAYALCYSALVVWGALALIGGFELDPGNFAPPFISLLLVPYGVAAWTDRSAWWLVLAFAAITTLNVNSDQVLFGDYLFPGAMAAGSFMAGRSMRVRSRLAAELHEAAVRAEEAHEQELERVAAEERRRIAREMHDVVAHSVSVMVVQAGGARRILAREPARAVDAATQIERTGREALAEMRRLLGVFGTDGATREPQPGLGQLERLVERAREAGLPVDVRVEGDARPLPPGIDLTAYRIVQEALTNVLKHVGPAPADVHLVYGREEVRVTVRNGRAPRDAERLDLGGSGHGLAGLRERVRVFGGDFAAQPRPGGGFVVHARLPLEDAEEAAGHTMVAA